MSQGIDHEYVDKLFTYRKWDEHEVDAGQKLRKLAKEYAHAILEVVPGSPERTLAIRALHECSIQVNTGITLYGIYDQEGKV